MEIKRKMTLGENSLDECQKYLTALINMNLKEEEIFSHKFFTENAGRSTGDRNKDTVIKLIITAECKTIVQTAKEQDVSPERIRQVIVQSERIFKWQFRERMREILRKENLRGCYKDQTVEEIGELLFSPVDPFPYLKVIQTITTRN